MNYKTYKTIRHLTNLGFEAKDMYPKLKLDIFDVRLGSIHLGGFSTSECFELIITREPEFLSRAKALSKKINENDLFDDYISEADIRSVILTPEWASFDKDISHLKNMFWDK